MKIGEKIKNKIETSKLNPIEGKRDLLTCETCKHFGEQKKIDSKEKKPVLVPFCNITGTLSEISNTNPCEHYYNRTTSSIINWALGAIATGGILLFFALT